MTSFMILFFAICTLFGWIGCQYANRDISLHTFPERKLSNLIAKLFATCIVLVATCQQTVGVPFLWLVPLGILLLVLVAWLVTYFYKKKDGAQKEKSQSDDSQMQLNEAILRTVSCVALAEMVGVFVALVIAKIDSGNKLVDMGDSECKLCLGVLLACSMLHMLTLIAYFIHIQKTAKEARESAGVVLLNFRKKTRVSPKI